MRARASRVVVTGGRHYVLSAEDFLLIEGTMSAAGARTICTDGTAGVADQVGAWAQRRGVRVLKVAANWIHEGPATPEERNTSLVELAGTVIAFPGEGPTEDLLEKARRRRLRIVESPGRLAVRRSMLDWPIINLTASPRQRSGPAPNL